MIRLKDERRILFQDAERLFKRDEGRKASFWKGKKKIEVWDLSGFEMEGGHINCVWCGIMSSGKKRGKSRTFYVACNDTGSGRLPGVMGND